MSIVKFVAEVKRFKEMGEKTGWTYIEIPATTSEKINPGVKKSYRVKGYLNSVPVEQINLLPMGKGAFIMALKKELQKKLQTHVGMKLNIAFEKDDKQPQLNEDLLLCLQDEKEALDYFNSLAPGHQRYFSNYISDAKTTNTKDKRLAQVISSCINKLDYGEMIRAGRNKDIY